MKRGPKPTAPSAKILRGTFKRKSEADVLREASTRSPPIMPSYLPPDAQSIWNDELERVVAFGVCDVDSSLFARFCALEARFRAASAAGEVLPTALSTELRRMAELLGIAGPKCRIVAIRPTSSNNPFARNGRKPN